jgi:hypothetical protein
MNGFLETWKFTRARMDQAWEDLTLEQLHWRPHSEAMTIAEQVLHVASAEHNMARRMRKEEPRADEFETKLDKAVRDGFLNDNAFPFSQEEMTKEMIASTLRFTGAQVESIMDDMNDELLNVEFETALGPMAKGLGGYQRMAQHPAYHTGQFWSYRMHPEFPC